METKSKRGFAAMSKEMQREIATRGGKAAHAKGTAHQWTSDEARRAGSKGGSVMKNRRAESIAQAAEKRRSTPPPLNEPAWGEE